MTARQLAISLVTFAHLAGCGPSGAERAALCPRHERMVELYEEQVRQGAPLRAYERRDLEEHIRYITRWCK